MHTVNQTPYFLKKAKKLLDRNSKLIQKTANTIEKLKLNPNNPSLKSHKVITPKFGTVFSSRVTGDLRIIWDFDGDNITVIDLLDIGGHSGGKGVY
jgi:mRNA-degrading endonuclease YafQ of YafQ-DinJ toxin-antitoxin module